MVKFEYHARDLAGVAKHGVIEGNSISEVYEALMQKGLTPVHIAPRRAQFSERKIKPAVDRRLRLSKRLQVKFVRRLADLLHAGIPLDRCLEILERAAPGRPFGFIAIQLKSHVQGGGGLADAIDSLGIGLPRFAGAMIRAGESAGDLEGALYSLADVVERDDELRRNIVGSLYYPAIVFAVSVIGVILMMVLVVPRFVSVFDMWGESLPWPTMFLMSMSEWLVNFGWVAVLVAVSLMISLNFYIRTVNGRRNVDGVLILLPGFGDLVVDAAISRFFAALAVTMRNGVTITDAFALAGRVLGNEVLAERANRTAERVKKGESLGSAAKQESLFRLDILELVQIGEETGDLVPAFDECAQTIERDLREKIKAMTTLFEPLMILALAGVIGFIVAAILFPTVNMTGLSL